MDLQQEWENMGTEFTDHSAPYTVDYTSIRKESKGLFETLVKNLNHKMTWIRVISIPVLIGAFFAEAPLKYLLLAVFAVYEIGRMLSIRSLKKINTQIDYTDITRTVLNQQIAVIKQVLRVEKIWGAIFIPLAAPVGYIASQLMQHKNIFAIWHQWGPVYIISGWLILIVLSFLLANWMNKIAFGNYLQKLNKQLAQLEE
jgi:hypothetical protein